MRLSLLSLCIGLCFSVQAQQKAKFKTANQVQKEDSAYRAIHPDTVKPAPLPKSTRKVDTAAWGALTTFGLVVVIPEGELAKATNDALGYGFQAAVLINPASRRNPFAWERRMWNVYGGAGFGYIRQGGLKQIITRNDTVADRQLTHSTINSLWTMDLIGRVEVFKGSVKLFAEASWGGSYFKAQQEIEYTERPLSSSVSTVNIKQTFGDSREWVGHYAYGGGFRTGSELLKMEFKLMYHVGQSVQLVDPNTVSYPATDNTLKYQTKKTSTNMFLPQMTISYLF